MRVALWIIQILLAIVFALAGFMKLTMPIAELAPQMQFVEVVPAWLVRFIGLAEMAGGVGLVVPALLRVKPWLTPLAASALGLVMAMAAGLHLGRAEYMNIGVTGLFFALLMFVAWGRFKAEPITARKPGSGRERASKAQPAHAQ
jgi:uncharacterized membrane protein YphA (DoxX/SURF4 family)